MQFRIGSDLVGSISDPAVAIDEGMNIVGCNAAAAQLLGRSADDVIGKPCNEIVCGLDVFGNRYCDEQCVLMTMIRRREPVHRMRLEIPTPSGERASSTVLSLRVPGTGSSAFTLVHIFLREDHEMIAAQPGGNARAVRESGPAAPPALALQALTPRETEVLRRLTEGESTPEIAASLSISPTTVRNHVQHVLQKLGVHSKTEAVALALRRGVV